MFFGVGKHIVNEWGWDVLGMQPFEWCVLHPSRGTMTLRTAGSCWAVLPTGFGHQGPSYLQWWYWDYWTSVDQTKGSNRHIKPMTSPSNTPQSIPICNGRSSCAAPLRLTSDGWSIGNGMSQGLKEEPRLFTGEGSGLVLERLSQHVPCMIMYAYVKLSCLHMASLRVGDLVSNNCLRRATWWNQKRRGPRNAWLFVLEGLRVLWVIQWRQVIDACLPEYQCRSCTACQHVSRTMLLQTSILSSLLIWSCPFWWKHA